MSILSNIPSHLSQYSIDISAGGRHSCGIEGGKVSCGGECTYGQCNAPAEFKFESIKVHAGWDQTCALDLHSGIACWGLNLRGQTDVPQLLHRDQLKNEKEKEELEQDSSQ